MGKEAIDNFFAAMDTYSVIAKTILKLVKEDEKPQEKPKSFYEYERNDIPERLTAEKIRELRQMTSWQLNAIFKHGKKPTIIDGTPEAFRELRQMNSWQLAAIFGDADEEDD